jgi:sterol desaturase/sphingolipid hydroxylase (fatty acid hydroxylase superfamily)
MSDLLPYLTPALTAVGLALLWSWETIAPFRESPRRWRHGARNLLLALGNTLVLAFTLGSLIVYAAGFAREHGIGLLNVFKPPSPWRLVLALLLLDAWQYLWHRANHVIPFLWWFHRMHHTDPAMDVTTATRFHPGELVASGVLRLGLLMLLGLSAEQLLLYDAASVLATQFHHSNVSLGRWDRWVRWLVVTPAMHQVHHSRLPRETHSNYAVVLTLWDHLARTFRMRDELSDIRLGLDNWDDPRWQTIPGMLKTPLSPEERRA